MNTTSSDFGSFGLQALSSIRKKASFKDLNKKEKVEVTDEEIDNILKEVLVRQKKAEYTEKVKLKTKSLMEVLGSTRDQRTLQKFSDISHKWRNDNIKISRKMNRPVQESLFASSDIFRRRKEIADKLESEKSLGEVMSPNYAWKISLRSGKDNSTGAQSLTSLSRSPSRNDYYGDTSVSRNVTTRLRLSDSASEASRVNNRSATLILKDRRRCLNDSMSQQLKLIKNSSFGAGMQSQFVEQVGSHDSGIWVRVKSNDARIKTSQAIIRKPISITREIAGQNDLVHPKAVPKIILEKYRKFYKNKNRLSGCINSSF
jgi:hypothetical protein